MKIAFVTSRFPFPIEKGDKLRAYQQIRWLSARHEVHVFAVTHHEVADKDISAIEAICAGLHIYRISRTRLPFNLLAGWLDGLPASVAYFLDQQHKQKMLEDIIQLRPDHMMVQLIRAAEYVRALPVPKTLDYMDVFSFGAVQRARSGPWILRPFYSVEARRLKSYERQVYSDFANHTIICAQDRDRLPLPYQEGVTILSNGVDVDYFHPLLNQPLTADVVFVGNLGYLPNIEAVEFLVKDIMPLVWKQNTHAQVCLAGARPHKRVDRLRSERVSVTGWVDDIRPYYAQGRVFVAPMLSGMGQQNKILEAMAMQRPCITTRLVDNAIGAEKEHALVVAEDAHAFADAICDMLDNNDKATRLGIAAREFVTRHYDWEIKNKALDTLLSRQTVSKRTEPVGI